VVVPLYDEAPNLEPLVAWIREALADYGGPFEIILIDDGSSDDTWARIRATARFPEVKGIRLARNVGQTAAMMTGFDHAQGDVVVSLDGDLQNDPRDIIPLVDKLETGYDLVSGWRRKRKDGLFLRKVPSWCANRLIRWLTGVPIRDNGCSLKAYRRDLLRRLSLYAEQHRFIPALAAAAGARIGEMPVQHHPRKYGRSKYGLSRTFKVLVDLATLKMLTSFRTRPLLGFGVGAAFSFAVAAAFALGWLVAYTSFSPAKAYAVVLPGGALLWAGTGLYLLMLGLIAEVALRADIDLANRTPLLRGER
jgi:dolichol-phosphate mannosyltransferase